MQKNRFFRLILALSALLISNITFGVAKPEHIHIENNSDNLDTNQSKNSISISISYFAGMAGVISPFIEYHPILPISALDLPKANYYKVTRDKHNRLLEMAYFERGETSNNAYFGTHKVSYIYQNKDDYERRYFDKDNQPASMWRHYYQGGDIHIERYKKQKDRAQVTLFDQKNNGIESGIGSHKFVAKFLTKNRFIQTQFTLENKPHKFRNAMPFMTTMITLDEAGFLDKVSNIDPVSLKPFVNEQVKYATLKVHFDEYGFETGWDYLDPNENLTDDKKESPNIARWSYYRQWTNRQLGQFKYMWVQVYNSTGVNTTHPNGATTIRYTKDETGRYIEAAFLDAEGNLFQPEKEGYAKRIFNYKADGSRVETRYDTRGALVELTK
ncbi:hypothetical protein [Aliikangiella sp. G2MR2-5]|uniref:hypothetical protein n=1 Tax=Aliikangiella sp. G2MR2-5 TaxID=2788943 RepID=UPI0018AC1ACF|nr:hypothetical protein [Aliikangiella sp. G2MR2-5]